jgi:hypothetical protein
MCFDNFTVQVCTVQACSQSPVPFFVDTNRASLSWSQISGRDQPGSGSTASSRDKESACRPYALRCYVDSVRNVRYITNAGGSSLIATVRCGDASQATHPKWRSWRRLRCCAALALNIVGRTSSFHFMVVSFHGRLISCWSVYQNPGKMPMQARGRLRGDFAHYRQSKRIRKFVLHKM